MNLKTDLYQEDARKRYLQFCTTCNLFLLEIKKSIDNSAKAQIVIDTIKEKKNKLSELLSQLKGSNFEYLAYGVEQKTLDSLWTMLNSRKEFKSFKDLLVVQRTKA